MLTEPANRNIAVRDLRFSARFESFLSGQSWYICRMAVLLLVFGPGRLDLVYSQPPEPSPETVSERTQPRELLQLVQETEDALAAGKWLQAAEQFAGAWELVCRDEDPLLLPDTAEAEQIPAGTSQQTAGGRSQLEALYRRAPPEFRREYQLQFTDLARQRLNEVLPSGDLAALKQIASRFRFLPAATDAARVIARIAIDRGDMLEAALQLELVRRIDTNPTPQLLLQIAVAEWSAGLDTDAVEVLRELTTHHPDARLSSGGAPLQLPTASDDPAAWLARLTGKPAGTVVPAWAQPLGNYRRTGLQGSAAVGIQPIWSENTFSVSDVLFDEKLSPIMDEAGGLLGRISGRSSTEQSTVVPVSQPVVIGDLLIFRTAAGAVRAVSRHTGEMAWETHTLRRKTAIIHPRVSTACRAKNCTE
jgi:hypothetical protein